MFSTGCLSLHFSTTSMDTQYKCSQTFLGENTVPADCSVRTARYFAHFYRKSQTFISTSSFNFWYSQDQAFRAYFKLVLTPLLFAFDEWVTLSFHKTDKRKTEESLFDHKYSTQTFKVSEFSRMQSSIKLHVSFMSFCTNRTTTSIHSPSPEAPTVSFTLVTKKKKQVCCLLLLPHISSYIEFLSGPKCPTIAQLNFNPLEENGMLFPNMQHLSQGVFVASLKR